MHRLRSVFRRSPIEPDDVLRFFPFVSCSASSGTRYTTTRGRADEQRDKPLCSATFRFVLLDPFSPSLPCVPGARTTLGAQRPAGVPFPYHNITTNQPPVHLQRRLLWTVYHRVLQPLLQTIADPLSCRCCTAPAPPSAPTTSTPLYRPLRQPR